MIVSRAGPALYIRTPWFYGDWDKVQRWRVGQSVVDFIGDRLIPSDTAQINTISAWNRSVEILRSGSDESPPIHAGGSFIGGSHTPPSEYELTITLDDRPLTASTGTWVGDELKIVESYGIPSSSALAAHKLEPIQATITIARRFNFDGFCRFKYELAAHQQIALEYMNGLQALHPTVDPGQALYLIVPGSNLANGIAIAATSNQERTLPVDDWDHSDQPPGYLSMEVRQSGTPLYALAMGFDAGQDRGTITTAFVYSAPGKMYLRGYEGPVTLQPGMKREISGFHGTYNRRGS